VLGDVLEGLSPAQAEAVVTDAAPLAIAAGPGSGKTRVLTRRVARRARDGAVDPAHVLVLTFSRRAASELFGRLRLLGLPTGAGQGGVVAGTFHAVAWAELSRHRADRGLAAPAVVARPARLLGPALASALGREPTSRELSALTTELTRARARGARPEDDPGPGPRAGRPGRLPAEAVAAASLAYERAKRDRGVLDLDDLLEACTRMLETDAEAAGIARWRHRHVFVDEYQDLNPAHRRLLRAWVGDRPDVCVVGDPDQAVYGFNGAEPDLFDRVADDWPGVRVLHLRENFRSSPEVVALADAVRPNPPTAVSGPGPGDRPSPAPPGPGVSCRPTGSLPLLACYDDDVAEAEAIAGAIARRRAPGRSSAGMAVLARTNARLRLVAAALDRSGIPWRLRDPRPLADREAVRSWLSVLPGAAPAGDLADVLTAADDDPDRSALDRALREYASAAPGGTVRGFVAWLDATGVTAEEASGPGVDLATFHRAKGLEWPSVWVAGVEEGLVPLTAADPAGLAEEQRLLYVAVTRAEDELAITWAARRRAADGRVVACRPSRWVADLESVRRILASEPRSDDQRARLVALRRVLAPAAGPAPGPAGPPDAAAERRRALLAWRAARARAAAVPPSVVLPDRVLAELAEAGPTTDAEVARTAGAAGGRAVRWAPELARLLEGASSPLAS